MVVASVVLGRSCELPVCAVGRGLWPVLGCRPFSQIALPVVVVFTSRMSPICSGAGWACWAVALSGGGFKLAGCSGGTLPVLLTVPALGGAVVPLAVCLVWLGMALGGP